MSNKPSHKGIELVIGAGEEKTRYRITEQPEKVYEAHKELLNQKNDGDITVEQYRENKRSLAQQYGEVI